MLFSILRLPFYLFFASPFDTWSSFFVLLVARVITFSLILRTYIAPWALRRVSRHVRVRSISLRSIRGIYFRKGRFTCRIERIVISFHSSRFEGSSRLSLRVEGFGLHVDSEESTSPPPTMPNPRQNGIPVCKEVSWLERALWGILYTLDPFIRPAARVMILYLIRTVVNWLPFITQMLEITFVSPTIAVPDFLGARITAEELYLHCSLGFTQMDTIPTVGASLAEPAPASTAKGINAWRQKVSGSFAKNLNKAWGQVIASGRVEFKASKIVATIVPLDNVVPSTVLAFPGNINSVVALRFSPGLKEIVDRSTEINLSLGEFHIVAENLRVALTTWKARQNVKNGNTGTKKQLVTLPEIPECSSPVETEPSPPPPVVKPHPPKRSRMSRLSTRFSRNSQFFESLSASMRSGSRAKSIDTDSSAAPKKPYLDFLLSVQITLSKCVFTDSLAHGGKEGRYEAVFRGISVSGGCRSDKHNYHSRWVGKFKGHLHPDDNEYEFRFAITGITVDRKQPQDYLRVISIGDFSLSAYAAHWPSPWISPVRLSSGDSNDPLVVATASIGNIDFTERLDMLVMYTRQHSPRPMHTSQAATKPHPRHLPRIILEAACGPTRASLICPNALPDGEPLALELRTDGFVFTTSSFFNNLPRKLAQQLENVHHDATTMEYSIKGHISPIFLRARNRWHDSIASFPSEDGDDPLIASCDFIEISGSGAMLGHIDEMRQRNVIDPTAGVLHLHTSSDFICVELWHPNAIALVQKIVYSFDHRQVPTNQKERQAIARRLPKGVNLSLSLGRIVGFVTAPDINPKEPLDMSRGIAARAAITLHYSCLGPIQTFFFERLLGRSHNRAGLFLPEEPSLSALNFAKAREHLQDPAAFVKVVLRNMVVRSALATQYSPDDPDMAEHDSFRLQETEILRVHRIDSNCHIGILGPSSEESCEITVQISQGMLTFRMLHVYSTTLALQTLRAILPEKQHTPKTSPVRSSLPVSIRFKVKGIEALAHLPHKDLQAELHDVDCRLALGQLVVDWSLFCINVVVSRVDRWLEDKQPRWEEMGSIQRGHVTIYTDGHKPIAFKASSLRIRIPYGYIFSDLVLDLSVIFKACRHLVHLIPTKQLRPMPTPPPEAAKKVPNMTFDIDKVSLEAADDDFESRLGLIWQTGLEAAKIRRDREHAFVMKVASIAASGETAPRYATPNDSDEYEFGPKHTVSVLEARERLDQVHYMDWKYRLEAFKQRQAGAEQAILEDFSMFYGKSYENFRRRIRIHTSPPVSPLFRALIHRLSVTISPPTFPPSSLPEFLHSNGNGMPLDTLYSLLVPLHLQMKLASLQISLRDYPLPLLNVPPSMNKDALSWSFSTNLVIAEEMGTDASVHWVPLTIVDEKEPGGQSKLVLDVPKTIMPVKTYADVEVLSSTPGITTISWGVSYQPATQDLMRVLDNLTSPPRDSSPALGFWDKLRLICHWKVKVNFSSDVRFHMKGSRNPYEINGPGAGLALSWQGSPVLAIGHENDNHELIQVKSRSMLLIVPRLDEKCSFRVLHGPTDSGDGVQKVCAAFSSGVCFGVGFFLERSCGPTAPCACNGPPFNRACRIFTFAPHYSVILEKKPIPPLLGSFDDSYRNFRSDFVHLSISLSSSLNKHPQSSIQPSSLHLTPNFFTHFWSWWGLFDSVLSLPIRLGSYYPPKHLSPKFGRHLATIKYRLMVSKLFLFHAYMENNQDTWADGLTPFVGIKAFIEEFHADMHQREEEAVATNTQGKNQQKSRRKPFYAAEVVLQGIDLRALSAVVEERAKKNVFVSASGHPSNYRARPQGSSASLPSGWFDDNDFVDINWRPPKPPAVTFIPAVTCPRFTYFKQTPVKMDFTTKFGHEESHRCLLGKEKSVVQIQLALVEDRIAKLRSELARQKPFRGDETTETFAVFERSIRILRGHAERLRAIDTGEYATMSPNASQYTNQINTKFEEWTEFDNVYQAHCPQINLDRSVRDILIQYYYCSRARRGAEYHMAARAVKFIRDQAEAALRSYINNQDKTIATQAVEAFRRIIAGDSNRPSKEHSESHRTADPLSGWSEGVLLEKRHFGLLIKPQVVLKTEGTVKALCAIAATEVRLKGFAILDEANKADPVSGKIMTRTYAKATELQTFAPASPNYAGDGHLPLEIFVDDKCDCLEFDRLVPQTSATLHYDKFNRLRLRNNVTAIRASDKVEASQSQHLLNQTDLIDIHVPQFTVIADDRHFRYISNIVTKLILFSDPAHKTRLNRLETLLFQYDFTDLTNAADVVMRLQSRIRAVKEELSWLEAQRDAEESFDEEEYHTLSANAFVLQDELNTIFETIKLAQDHADDRSDQQKSALLLHTSSSEISWRMFERDASLAKLAVHNPHFRWLSRQDGSMENTVTIGDLQAFDTSPDAVWAEILAKYDEATGHPMYKSGLFALAEWVVLPPVGGITIYERFKLDFHPMRIQIDSKLGTRILEYVLPGRKERRLAASSSPNKEHDTPPKTKATRASLDSPTSLRSSSTASDHGQGLAPPSLRRLGVSRSFTDLRSASIELRPQLKKTKSIIGIPSSADEAEETLQEPRPVVRFTNSGRKIVEGATVMKNRASQKTFVHVQISSLHLLLSIAKEQSFECTNARIRTRELEYHNETTTFEEMVNRFIPSDLSWKGWVKMAFNQPLVPVLPVARELLSKTKFVGAHKGNRDGSSPPPGSFLRRRRHSRSASAEQAQTGNDSDSGLVHITSKPFVDEPEEERNTSQKRPPRARLISLFNRHPRKPIDTPRQETVRSTGRSLDVPRPSH